MTHNRIFAVLLLFTGIAVGHAQDSATVATSKMYSLHQSPEISALMEQYKTFNRKREGIDGYRLQISYTDVREEAYKGKAAMYREFPELKSYVEYEQPYYKLRIGDFRTRLEATYYLQQVILLYPGAFIVKDKVKLN